MIKVIIEGGCCVDVEGVKEYEVEDRDLRGFDKNDMS